jgi:ligand-binding sensor domain-containing protein
VRAGAVEIDLARHHVVQHRALAEGERPTPEMLPLPSALTGVLFDDAAIWFSSLSGVSRWHEGQLRTWGESDGLLSELVHAVAKAPGDAIWAATSEGVARLDGKVWRAVGGGEEGVVASHGLARDAAGAMWIATAKGLRHLTIADAQVGRLGDVVVGGDMRDVHIDPKGRVWALSSASIVLVTPPTK